MDKIERKAIPLELKDIDKGKRTAVIAHAAYNNIDRTDDIIRKGAFTKSWSESKADISLYFNHDDNQSPGKVLDVYEDDQKAYTVSWYGTHTLGNDVLTMLDEGVIRKASFGYITVKSNPLDIKGKKVRELKELMHIETSPLTKMPANPNTSIVSVVKSFESPEEAEMFFKELKSHLTNLEKFCRNTSASDECIINALDEIKSINNILSKVDTASTHIANEPSASEKAKDQENEQVLAVLRLLNLKIA